MYSVKSFSLNFYKDKEDNFDLKHINHDPIDDSDSEINKQTSIQLRRNSVQSWTTHFLNLIFWIGLFEGYDFDAPSNNTSGNKNVPASQNTQPYSTHTQSSSNK